MAGMKRSAALFLLLVLFAGVFAQSVFAQAKELDYFDGDMLNERIRSYVTNVSNLMPDSTTSQNIWSFTPRSSGFFAGIGVNGSVTFLDQKLASRLDKLIEGGQTFGGDHNDLSQFPESIPFLPGIAIDIRTGAGFFDVGVTGMWLDDTIVTDAASEYIEGFGSTFLGKGSHMSFRSIGADLRYTFIREGQSRLFFNTVSVNSILRPLLPNVTFQGGYNFTWMQFGISAGSTEKVSVDFRNDTIFMALQVSKTLFFLTPYVGAKLIFSKTDSGFTWETHRDVLYQGEPYVGGAIYNSGANLGEFLTYFQIYGGLGLDVLFFPHLITLGGVYNVVTEHFGVNLSVRLMMK